MRYALLTLALTLALLSCEESEPPSLTELRATAPVLKIKVLTDGSVLADDQAVDLDELSSRVEKLAEANGVVWYYRQDAGSSPHPVAMQVIGLLVDHQLPISLSTQPDFSDIIEKNAGHDPSDESNSPEPPG